MALTWRIPCLKVNLPFPLSDVLHLYGSLHWSRCFGSTLMLKSSPHNKQCCNQLNFGTSDCLCRFGDSMSLEQLTAKFVFQMSIICVFDMYIEEDDFWGSLSYSDSNLADYCIKNLFLICLPPIWSIIFSLNYFALQHLFESYLNILWTCTLPVQTLLPEMYDNASKHWEMHMENI